MANNSASLFFPFQLDGEINSLKRATTVNDTIASAIRIFLLTKKGNRRGNPIGSLVPDLKQKLISTTEAIGIQADIKQELTDQFKGVIFSDVTLASFLENEISVLSINISFSTPISDVSQISILI